MRSITGTHAAASGRAGSNTIARLNTVAQSSSVRVTPRVLVSCNVGSGFCATAAHASARRPKNVRLSGAVRLRLGSRGTRRATPMAGRRDQIRMTPEEIDAYLDEQKTLQVASIDRDGTPHLVAMWFARWDGKLAFWTYGKSQKVLNVQRDPRITV